MALSSKQSYDTRPGCTVSLLELKSNAESFRTSNSSSPAMNEQVRWNGTVKFTGINSPNDSPDATLREGQYEPMDPF